MDIVAGDSVVKYFTTHNPAGELSDADSTPTGQLYVDGSTDAAGVTVTNISTGLYKAAFTAGAWSAGECVDLVISATIDSTSDKASVMSGVVRAAAATSAALATVDTVVDAINDKLGTPTNGDLAADVAEVLTSANSAASSAGSAASAASAANSKLGTPAGVSVSADIAAAKSDTAAILTRIPSALFSGITSLANWLGALAGKTADASTLAEIQATTAGAGFDNTVDSLEANQEAVATVDAVVDGLSAGSTSGAYLNRKPDQVIQVSTKADGYVTRGRVRIVPGTTMVVALAYPDPSDWLYGMDLPVSPDTDTLTVDGSAYGVNRNYALVEVTCPSGAAVGTEVSLPMVVQPEQATEDVRKVLFEVIDPDQ